jgi:hypothetical protein
VTSYGPILVPALRLMKVSRALVADYSGHGAAGVRCCGSATTPQRWLNDLGQRLPTQAARMSQLRKSSQTRS